jgi:hypothetical protein
MITPSIENGRDFIIFIDGNTHHDGNRGGQPARPQSAVGCQLVAVNGVPVVGGGAMVGSNVDQRRTTETDGGRERGSGRW